MVSELAKGDWEELRSQGLNPTIEDFDRLNQLAIRLKDGDETTCANFPRVGWAGDIPFFEPTIQAFAWYHGVAIRFASDADTENTFWAFALAHARERGAFDALQTCEAIETAVGEWASTLPVTRDEVLRACRYAARGFDDADPARVGIGNPVYRASRSEAAKNLANVERVLTRACAALRVAPESVMHETPTRLDRLCEAAAVELGKPIGKDEAKLRTDYDLTLREIILRLKEESVQRNRECADKQKGGDGVSNDIPLVAGSEPVRPVADGASSEEPKEAVVVVHGDNDTKSAAGGQG